MTMRQLQTLPAEISRPLQQLDRKVRWLATLRGAAVLVTLLITGIGLGLLADLWLGLAETVRMVWLGLLSAAAVAVVVWGVIGPWFRRSTPADLAALVEFAHPELRERLTSTVELLRPDLPEADKGSALMRELLVAETKSIVRKTAVDDAVEGERTQRAGWFAVAAMFAMIVPLFISRDGYTLLLSRFFTPWQNLEQASNLYFVVEPGDRTAPRGSDVVIEAAPQWRLAEGALPQEVWLHWSSPTGETDERRMLWHPDHRRFTATLPHVFHSFDFRVTSGSARTREYHVNVVEPPSISALVVDVQPPAYTGLPAQRLDGAVGETTVFERSRVRFELQFNKPLAAVNLVWFAHPTSAAVARPQAAALAAQPRTASPAVFASPASAAEAVRETVPLTLAADGRSAACDFEALPESGGRFAIRLTDEHGLTNPQEPIRSLRVQRDQPPTVAFADQIDQPEARPDDVLSLPATAGDDVAVHDLELHYAVVPQGGRNLVPAEGRLLGVKSVDHLFSLSLAELTTDLGVPLHLKNNDRLRLKLRAADERPIPGPNEAWSEERTIQIRDDAAPYGFEMLAQSRAQWRKMLEEIRQQLETNRTQVADLKTEADADQRQQLPFDQNAAIPPLATHQREQATRLEQLAALLASSPLYGNLTSAAQGVAREELGAAPRALDAAAAAAALPQKAEQLESSLAQVESAIAKLTALEEDFNKIADLERDLSEIQRLADRAQRLADDAVALDQDRRNTPADLAPDRQAARDAALEQERRMLAEEHLDLSRDLASLLDRRPEILDAAREQQFDRLRELARQALELAAPQDQLAADLHTDAAQQSGDLQPVRERQQELLQAAQELQGATEENQSRQIVTPLALDALRAALDELAAGNTAQAVAEQQHAAAELERLAVELRQNDLLPADPHAAALQLVERETALGEQIQHARQSFEQARQAAQDQPADAAAQQRLVEARQTLRNLAAAQTAIQSAAAHLPVPRGDEDKVRDAVKQAFETVTRLIERQPDRAADEAEQTRRALQALADDIGPPDKRGRETAAEARRLREQQESLAREMAEVAQRAPEDPADEQHREQLSQLAGRERQLARELAQLAPPDAAESLQREAHRQVAAASARMEQQQTSESAAAARQAAQALADLEQSLANKAPAAEQLAELTAREQRVGEQLADDGQPPSAEELEAAGLEQREAARAVSELRTPLLEPQRDAARELLEQAARAADAAAGDASQLTAARREATEAQQALEQLQAAVSSPSEPPSPDQRQQMQRALANALAPQAQPLQQVAENAAQLAQRQADLRNKTEALAQEHAAAQAETDRPPPDPALSREQQQQLRREQEQQARDRQRRIDQQTTELRRQQEQLTRDISSLPPEAAGLAAAEAARHSADARDALNQRQPAQAAEPQTRTQTALEDLAAAARGRRQAQLQSAEQLAQAALQAVDPADNPTNADPMNSEPGSSPSEQLARRAEDLAEQQRQLAAGAQQSRQQRLEQPSQTPTAAATPSANPSPSQPVASNPTPADGTPTVNASPVDPAAASNTPTASPPAEPTPAEQTAAALATQQQLAQQAAQLALAAAEQAGVGTDASQAALQFAEQAAEAARAAAAGQLPHASQGGRQAVESAQQAAERLQTAGPGTPEAELATQAANLAARQQAVARQWNELAASPVARAAAQSQAQQRMATQAEGLATEFEQIAGELGAQPLDRPQQGQQAGAARQSSQQASQAIQQSEGNLSAGNPQSASAEARQGARQLRDAAAQALAAAGVAPANPSAVPQEVGSQLTQAMRQLQAAGEQLSQALAAPPSGQAQANSGQPAGGQPPGPPQTGQSPPAANAENAAGQPMPGQPMPGQPGQPGEPQPGAEQTAAADAMSGDGQPSSRPEPGQPTNPSAQSLQDVAQALNQAAEELGLTPGQMQGQKSQARMAQPGGTPTPDGESSDTGAQETLRLTDLDVQLKNITTRNWGELPGKLQTEILQSSQSRTAGDYGTVIQRYFEEVTRSRTTPTAAP